MSKAILSESIMSVWLNSLEHYSVMTTTIFNYLFSLFCFTSHVKLWLLIWLWLLRQTDVLTVEIHPPQRKRPERPEKTAGSERSSSLIPYLLWMFLLQNTLLLFPSLPPLHPRLSSLPLQERCALCAQHIHWNRKLGCLSVKVLLLNLESQGGLPTKFLRSDHAGS